MTTPRAENDPPDPEPDDPAPGDDPVPGDDPAPGDDPVPGDDPDGDGRRHFRDARHVILEAAEEAERRTGEAEETEAEVRRGVAVRTARAVGGFLVVGVGIALLPLPGPGWLMIIVGLSMLPYAWAERTISTIRRRIPGIPDDGAIPVSTWVVMGLMVAAFTTLSILFGRQIGQWLEGVWTDLFS